ncbi:H/ACA ribonucleoprotein complex subunit 2-like protein [Ixodes scapularis]
MPKIKRERTEEDYADDGVTPPKKSKKDKSFSLETVKQEHLDDSTRADENGDTEEMTYEEKLQFVNAIAHPMASKKFTKKLFKLVKKASKHKGYVLNGLKEVQSKIRKGQTGLVILAGDVSPIDIFSHIPGICEEKGLPYIFTPSRRDMATAMGMKRPLIILMIKEHADYKELMDECSEVIQNLDVMV